MRRDYGPGEGPVVGIMTGIGFTGAAFIVVYLVYKLLTSLG